MPTFSLRRVLNEVGLTTLIKSPFDVKLLCIQRFVRMFAFGSAALILALHLEALGYSDQLTGLFMTLTMLGDVVISLVLTMFADRLGRKNVLVAGSLLVSVSGVVFATTTSYWALLAAAIFGVISPSGNEIGPFRAIEESTLSSLAPSDTPDSRSDLFAWYTLIGTLGAAFGTAAAGGMVHELMHRYAFSILQSYRSLFWLYSALGIIKSILAACLSRRIEVDAKPEKGKGRAASSQEANTADIDDERRPLLQPTPVLNHNQPPSDATSPTNTATATPKTKSFKHLLHLPQISSESRTHLSKILPLFALDSFASGLVPLSWMSPFFQSKHHMSHSALGSLFFFTSLVSAVSNIFSASFVRRAGLLYTMVFTHLPNNVFLALIPVPGPHLTWLAILFLLLRNATSTMDTAPRQAFLTTLLDPTERTAVMGFVNVVRTVCQAVGPYVSGVLKNVNMLWVSFVLSGALKVVYDLGMLGGFWGYRRVVKRESGEVDAERE